MSVINKKPFIQTLLSSLTSAQIGLLKSELNSSSNERLFRSFLNDSYPITTEDKGVQKAILEVKDKVYTGILVFTDDYCVLISYQEDTDQKLEMLILDYENKTYSLEKEPLTINELRSELDDTPDSEEAEIVSVVNEAIESGDIVPNGQFASQTDLGGINQDLTSLGQKQNADYGILENAIEGALKYCLITSQEITYDNAIVLDLGSLPEDDYYPSNTEGKRSEVVVYNKTPCSNVAFNTIGKAICSKYKMATSDDTYAFTSGLISLVRYNQNASSGTNDIYICDNSFVGMTKAEMKAALKGVLIAYEKGTQS